jgi:hypothetical protein
MLSEWIYWLTTKTPQELLWILAGLFLIDGPRYALFTALIVQWDALKELYLLSVGRTDNDTSDYCPSVCVLLVGHNESGVIPKRGCWGIRKTSRLPSG